MQSSSWILDSNGRPVDARFRQAQSQKLKVLDLRNITSNTLSASPANA